MLYNPKNIPTKLKHVVWYGAKTVLVGKDDLNGGGYDDTQILVNVLLLYKY